MLLMNVPDVLLRFRASTISLGNLSGCSDRNFLVKDGEPFSVLKYSMPILSKALAMDAAAQISMSQPEIRFISLWTSFSRFRIAFRVISALSISTRIPRHVMSTRQGRRSSSSSVTPSRFSCLICTDR